MGTKHGDIESLKAKHKEAGVKIPVPSSLLQNGENLRNMEEKQSFLIKTFIKTIFKYFTGLFR